MAGDKAKLLFLVLLAPAWSCVGSRSADRGADSGQEPQITHQEAGPSRPARTMWPNGVPARDAGAEQDAEESQCVPRCEQGCCADDGCGGRCEQLCAYGSSCDSESCTCQPWAPCAEVSLPMCETTSPPPLHNEEIQAFIADQAVPIRCNEQWDLRIFSLELTDHRLFMFGEIHGSNELGKLSTALFEHLVREGTINGLALEFAMDATGAINEYIQTGQGPLLSDYGVDGMPRTMFIPSLIHKARLLWLDGYDIEAFGSDYPLRLRWVNEQIELLANQLSETPRSMVVDAMPVAPDHTYPWVDADFYHRTRNYEEHIINHLSTICAELDQTRCHRLQMLSKALWIGVYVASGRLYTSTREELWEFFEQREAVITSLFLSHMAEPSAVVYAHMGAAHTAQRNETHGYGSVAQHLATEAPSTRGRVYSTRAAYGPGSRVQYGGFVEHLSAEPMQIASALAETTQDYYHLSTRRPSHDCQDSPIANIFYETIGSSASDAYNCLVYVRELTPEGTLFAHGEPHPFVARQRAIEHARWRAHHSGDEE